MFINGLTAGPGLQVINGQAARPYTSGVLHWDHTSNCVKVLDPNGNANSQYLALPSVSLDDSTINALAWVKKKMIEEKKIEELMLQHPGLKDLKEKFDIMLALVQKEPIC